MTKTIIKRICKHHGETDFSSICIKKKLKNNIIKSYDSFICLLCYKKRAKLHNNLAKLRRLDKNIIKKRKKDFRYYLTKNKYRQKLIKNFTGNYLKKILASKLKVKSYDDICPNILELARANFLLKREIKKRLKK